ncbi:MAG: hypothetical protein KKD35_01560, partial [Elusimicrobia bacterium]|nr:hypothetical protein [Elusimicrobiota bacterium]
MKKGQNILRKITLAKLLFVIGAFLFLCFPYFAHAVENLGEGLTRFSNTRKVIYQPGMGRYWMFYNLGTEFGYRSYDNQSLTDFTEVFPAGDLSGDQNPGTDGSVWHVEASSYVYVVVGDDNIDITATNGGVDDMFVRRGLLNADGSITWGSLSEKNPMPTTFPWRNSGYGDPISKGHSGGIALVDNTITAVVGGLGEEENVLGVIRAYYGFVGMSGISNNATMSGGDNIGFGNGDRVSSLLTTLPENEAGVVPVNDGGIWRSLISYMSDGAAPRLYVDAFTGSARTKELLLAVRFPPDSPNGDGLSMAVDPTGNSYAYLAYINDAGELKYTRRTGFELWDSIVTVDVDGAAALTPYLNPSIGFLNGATDKVYIVYTSTYGSLNYAVGDAIASPIWTITRDWQPAGEYPNIPIFNEFPFPIPVTYSSGGNAYLDFLICSTYNDPQITSVTLDPSEPANPWLTKQSYKIKITGTDFL